MKIIVESSKCKLNLFEDLVQLIIYIFRKKKKIKNNPILGYGRFHLLITEKKFDLSLCLEICSFCTSKHSIMICKYSISDRLQSVAVLFVLMLLFFFFLKNEKINQSW